MTQDSQRPAERSFTPLMPRRVRLRIDPGPAAECRTETLWIVKDFDLADHAQSRVSEILKGLVIGPLVFEGPEEAFYHGVNIGAAGAAHDALNAQDSQGVLIGVAGVLSSRLPEFKSGCNSPQSCVY